MSLHKQPSNTLWAVVIALCLCGGHMHASIDQGSEAIPASSLKSATQFLADTSVFEIIILGDVQNYNDYPAPNLFGVQTAWIKNNLQKENIVFVTQVGDVTNNGWDPQWQAAGIGVSILDGPGPLGVVPYSITFGNHDVAMPGPFGASRYQPYAYEKGGWYGGSTPNELCHYQIFRAGGYSFLHLNMVENPNYDDLQWAKSILEANPDKPTIITTHEYVALNYPGRNWIGNMIYTSIVNPYPQVFLVICGHGMPARHETPVTTDGRMVVEMMVNYQNTTHGGDAWLQKAIFDPNQGKIKFRTFSPTLNTYLLDHNSEFELAADFNESDIRIKGEILESPSLEFRGTNDRDWQNATNWHGQAPKGGETLWFYGDGNSTNTLPNGSMFQGLVIGPGAGSHHFYGNGITLIGQILDANYIGNPSFVRKPSILDPFFNGYGINIHMPVSLEREIHITTGLRMTTIHARVSGSGGISVGGGGILMLTSSNDYEGGTVINGAELVVSNPKALGAGDVVINSGFLKFVLPSDQTNIIENNILLPSFCDGSNPNYGDSQFWLYNPVKPSTLKITGKISGGHQSLSYNFVDTAINNNYNAILTLVNISNDFKGTIKVVHGTLAIDSDEALGNKSNGIQSFNGGYKGGIRFDKDNILLNSNRTLYLGSAEIIDVQNYFTEVACPIMGSGSLLKLGPGTLLLSGKSAYMGITTVSNGTLLVNGTLMDGNAVNISEKGTIGGNGLIDRALFVNGSLSPGVSSCATLTISNLVSLRGLTLMELSKSSAGLTNDSLAGVSTLTYGGVLLVTNIGPSDLTAGDRFRLFNAAKYTGQFSKVLLPPLPDNAFWDVSELKVNGTLSVASKPEITGITLLSSQDGAAVFQFTLPNQVITNFTLLESTNLLTWTILATNLQHSNGTFQFVDPDASRELRRFYRLRSP